MDSKSSYGTSWADQWDYGSDPLPSQQQPSKSTGGPKSKYSKKVEDGLGKTKAVAVTGMKKAKVGAVAGISWIKEKCNKTTQKQN